MEPQVRKIAADRTFGTLDLKGDVLHAVISGYTQVRVRLSAISTRQDQSSSVDLVSVNGPHVEVPFFRYLTDSGPDNMESAIVRLLDVCERDRSKEERTVLCWANTSQPDVFYAGVFYQRVAKPASGPKGLGWVEG